MIWGYNRDWGKDTEEQTSMEKCLAYIDQHLNEALTPQSIADWMGYSFYHFCHVFSIYNEMPIGEYLRKQRLTKAANALCAGERITDVALSLGFKTPSGFAKAFKKEYGMSASAYRKRKKEACVKPKILQKDRIKTVGYCIPPKEGKEFHPYKDEAQWFGADFSSVSKEDYLQLAKKNKGEIGMWYRPEQESGSLTYFFGPVVSDFSFLPLGMIPLEIPAATYAVFTTETVDVSLGVGVFLKAIKETWKYVYGEWFEQNPYQYAEEKLAFEYYYDEKQSGRGYASADIYVPVREV